MKRGYPIAIAISVALSGLACAHPPKSYSFTLAQPKDAMDVVLRTLATNGFKDVAVDSAKSTVITQWFDTGYRYRATSEINNGPVRKYYTDVFLRYRISVLDKHGQQTVTLETDVQRCAPTDSVITAQGVDGTCLPMTEVFPTQQDQVDDMGNKLKLALSGG